MIYISGEYILESSLKQLKLSGIDEILIVVNHKKEIIQDYFQYGKNIGLKLNYIHQKEEQGIGHAIKICAEHLKDEEPFLLIYGDVLFGGNHFRRLLDDFKRSQGGAMATVTHPFSEGSYGNIYLNHEMKISKFIEKPEQERLSNYIFGGTFILPHKIFQLLKEMDYSMVSLLQRLIEKNMLYASLWEEGWIDISRPWHILLANQMIMHQWETTMIPSSAVIDSHVNISGPVHIGENVRISSGTTIKGPCYIGKNVFIGHNSLIREYSSIGPDSKVGYGTEVKNAVLFGKTQIGRLSFVGDSVVGENVKIGSGTMTVNYNNLGSTIQIKTDEGEFIDTELKKLGAFIGDGSMIGANHTIGPGVSIPAGKQIPDHLSISK